MYRNVGVLNRGRGLFEKPELSGSQTAYFSLFRIQSGQLIYSKLFAWEGAVAVVDESFNGAFVSSEFPTFTIDAEMADPGYLRHFTASQGFVDHLQGLTSGLGQRRQRVNVDQFLSVPVPLPHIEEQRRIAAHLDNIERAARQSTDFSARCSSIVAVVRDAPWGGEATPIGDLVDPVVRSLPVIAEERYRLHGVRWYGEGLFVREQKSGRDLSANTVYRIENGDLVYNRLFAWKQSFALAESVCDAYVSNEFPTFRIRDDRVLPRFLLAALLTRDFTAQVNDASTGSTPTSRNRLKEGQFLRLQVNVPNLPVQAKAVRALELTDKITHVKKRSAAFADALLPAARNEVFSALR